jgi:hypothetical protein
MKSLFQYITEFKTDLMPQCVVVIGGPGAGKTYWMNNSSKKFFQNNITPRKLDSDWNLAKYQKNHMNEFAENLLKSILPNAVSSASSRKQAFKNTLDAEQEKMNAAVDYGRISNTLDITPIKYEFVRAWADRYDNAQPSKKEEVLRLYLKAFSKEYFDDLFASDFSVRKFSKEEYKKDFERKLRGELEEIDFVGPSDVIIAITGDDMKKFQDIVDVCGKTHSITVVYLNVPAEMSVRQDAERKRTMGEKLVRSILADVHKTWEILVKEYKQLGITKLVEMKTDPDLKHPQWEVAKEYINYELIKKGK